MNSKVKVINKSLNALPQYETENSAGLDIRANLVNFSDNPEEVPEVYGFILKPNERKIIPTGLFLEIPKGYEAQVRPRSGMAIKQGITVLNSPGTIDSDYRGEVGVILVNLGTENQTITHGDRIAQLVFAKHERAEWEITEELSETERGDGGFGSTGVK